MRSARLGLPLLLFFGCASLSPRPQDPGLFLLKPQDAGGSYDLTQTLSFERGKTHFEGLALLEVRPDHIALAGLSPLGNRIMSLRWDGDSFSEERDPSIPREFPLKLILRDLQLAYWPKASIQAALPSSWSLHEEALLRELDFDGKPQIQIRYDGPDHWSQGLSLENLALGYHIRIEAAPSSERGTGSLP